MLYIRTDMNDSIATGHVMRCLAIADALRERGEDTTFILADGQAVSMLRGRGYQSFVLHTHWDDMESELRILEKLIAEDKIRQILIDSYQVTEQYLRRLQMLVKTIYIDDLASFVYPVDILICYAVYFERFKHREKYKKTELYLGPSYTPLRKEFCNPEKKRIKRQVENLLLLSGGTDHYHVLDRILERIEPVKYQEIDVICGIYDDQYNLLCEKYSGYKNVRIHKSVKDIENYMKYADLVVTAGGTTLYELCALGTPAISYSIADNQLENVRKFQENKTIDCAGDIRFDAVIDNVIDLLGVYHSDTALRREKSLRMQKLVDSEGAGRIADILLKY